MTPLHTLPRARCLWTSSSPWGRDAAPGPSPELGAAGARCAALLGTGGLRERSCARTPRCAASPSCSWPRPCSPRGERSWAQCSGTALR